MAIIKKKIWPKYFDLVKSGKKKFGFRKKVKYVLKFRLDKFGQKKEIEKKGLYGIQL